MITGARGDGLRGSRAAHAPRNDAISGLRHGKTATRKDRRREKGHGTASSCSVAPAHVEHDAPVGGAFIPYLGCAIIMSMIRHTQDEKFDAVFYFKWQ
jgi:hypothetical protein